MRKAVYKHELRQIHVVSWSHCEAFWMFIESYQIWFFAWLNGKLILMLQKKKTDQNIIWALVIWNIWGEINSESGVLINSDLVRREALQMDIARKFI